MKLLLLISGILLVVQGCPRIIKHSDWTSIPSECNIVLEKPEPFIVIHHTSGKRCFNMSECKEELEHILKNHISVHHWCDICYNFVIGEDGNIYEGRGWDKAGAHTHQFNHLSFGIAFMGNFMDDSPNHLALTAARRLIKCAVYKKYLVTDYILKGHKDLGETSCPGNTLYNIIKKWPKWQAA